MAEMSVFSCGEPISGGVLSPGFMLQACGPAGVEAGPRVLALLARIPVPVLRGLAAGISSLSEGVGLLEGRGRR